MVMNLFHKDEVTLYKANGVIAEKIKAHVQPKLVFIDVKSNKDMPAIEAGDIIEHIQTNGITEQYQVLDPCYYDETTFGEHYQCKVRKLSAIDRQNHNNININAAQANIRPLA